MPELIKADLRSQQLRMKVFMLLWKPVYAHCPLCLRETECYLRMVRLTDGSELRELCCQSCPFEKTPIFQMSAEELAQERAEFGDHDITKNLSTVAKRLLKPETQRAIEEKKANERRADEQRELKRQRLAVPGTPRPLPEPKSRGDRHAENARYYPEIVRGPPRSYWRRIAERVLRILFGPQFGGKGHRGGRPKLP